MFYFCIMYYEKAVKNSFKNAYTFIKSYNILEQFLKKWHKLR